MKRFESVVFGAVILLLTVSSAWGRGALTSTPPNRLLTGKLIYVGPMPHGLRDWLIQDFKDWGKYSPTEEEEGVDLVMEARWTRRRIGFVLRQGVPVPRQERPRKGKKKIPIFATLTVRDWVTGARLWRADLLDKKPKNHSGHAPSGSETEIRARKMSSAQLAETVVRRLRLYVKHLEDAGSSGPAISRRP
jgi:hypothetical protein